MRLASRNRTRLVAAVLAIFVVLVVLLVWLGKKSRNENRELLVWSKSSSPDKSMTDASTPSSNANSGLPSAPSPTSSASPTPNASATPNASPIAPSSDGAELNGLIIPVAGVKPDQLRDTFTESRAEGRVHDAIDIPAPSGTPVLATADGTIVKLFHSERGGTTIYQLSTNNKWVYYYAHLDRYAEGLAEGHFARQGETIAYVGDTGNAGAGNYHLHFSIASIPDAKHYWQGVNINPYPLLKR